MADGIENAQAGIGAVPGHDDHLHQPVFGGKLVQAQERAHQFKARAGLQRLVFVLHLVIRMSCQALFHKNPILLFQVKQRPGRNADHQRFGQIIRHADASFA